MKENHPPQPTLENPSNATMALHMAAVLSALVAADAVVDAVYPQGEEINSSASLLQFAAAIGVSFVCAALPRFIEDRIKIDRMNN